MDTRKVGKYERITNCLFCGRELSERGQRLGAHFCCEECRAHYRKELHRKHNKLSHKIPSGSRGAISELRVAADLLDKGFEVFRALSPHCSCDLAVLEDGKLARVEVKTGYYSLDENSVFYPKSPNSKKYDLLAVVLFDKIIYEPSLDELFPKKNIK